MYGGDDDSEENDTEYVKKQMKRSGSSRKVQKLQFTFILR